MIVWIAEGKTRLHTTVGEFHNVYKRRKFKLSVMSKSMAFQRGRQQITDFRKAN